MRLPVPFSKVKSHEEIFVEHYDWLVSWALHFSQELREDANDLVHDLYLQLIRSRPNLDAANEDRTRAYLYTMLHNLAISKARRSGHDPLTALSIVDYDSVDYGLASVDRSQLIFVRSDLARICEYASRRKQSSRAASVLILRFFLSYYPSEIVRILQTTRVAVENHLRSARIEARAYLKRPQSLHFLGHDITPTPAPLSLPDNPELLFLELRRRIFENNSGECLKDEVIEARYGNDYTPMDASELAHIVGCPRCLEKINQVLGLPSLTTRFPADAIDRDSGGNEPPAPSSGGDDLISFKRKFQQTYEHQPRKLQIAVDGEICAAQRVSQALNELQVNLNPLQKPSFVEVFSEQGVRLLYLQLDNSVPAQPSADYVIADLSDGRSIELQFSQARGSAIACAIYSDPHIPKLLGEELSLLVERKPLSVPVAASPEPIVLEKNLHAVLRRVRSLFGGQGFMLPIWIGLILTSLGIFAFQNFIRRFTPTNDQSVTTQGLLAESKAAEKSHIAAGGAVHSTFALTTLSATGTILDTQTVERWDSLQPRRSALRLVDKKGATLAGRWKNQQGKITDYIKGHGMQSENDAMQAEAAFRNAWELVPGADVLPTWNELGDEANAHLTAKEYEIHYQRAGSRSGSGVVRASLVLEASTVRAVREDVILEEGGTTREYRFEPLTYEIVPASRVQDSDFAPPAELASLRSGLNGSIDVSEQWARLMLSALELLDTFGPEVSDAVDLERLPDGKVQLSGVLPTRQQRDTVVRSLMSLRAGDQLKLVLHSSDESSRTTDNPKQVQVEDTSPVAVEETRVPLDPAIRATLIAQGVAGPDLETRIRKIASDAVDDAGNVHRDAWVLRQIASEDFSPYDLQRLRREDQIRWIALLHAHARSLHQHLAILSRDLNFLAVGSSSSPAAPIAPLGNTPELAQAAEDLNRDCEQINRLLTDGLTLAPSSSPPTVSASDVAALLEQIETREKVVSATVERLSSVR